MDDQNTTEQQRRQRADIVDAFSRRAWQPSERPKAGPRILAGGAALIVVAGGALAAGAMTSHDHKNSAGQRMRTAAMARTDVPAPLSAPQSPLTTSVPPSGTPRPGARPVGAAAGHNPASRRSGSGPGKMSVQNRSRTTSGVRIAGKRHVLIRNVVTGLCADVPAYGKGSPNGGLQQHTCDGSSGDNQLWNLVVGSRSGGPQGATLFTIRNAKDGLCLDLPGYGTVQQGDVTEYRCHPGAGDNQMWYLDRKASGRYWIRAYYSVGRQCLDVSGLHGSGGMDAKLTIFPCSLQDDHLWSFS